jgi:hypothetical protein
MSNSASPSIYEILKLTKLDKVVRLDGKTVSFDYYESLRSPNITARIAFVDVGGSTNYNTDYDPQGDKNLGTIYSALPLTADGSEKVNFKISSKLGSLDFSEVPLIVNNSVNLDQESQRESVFLSLVSQSAIKNKESRVKRNYSGSTSNNQSVTLIAKEILNLQKIDIEETSNKYSFIGNNMTPFEVIMNLAKKSVPLNNGNPGFFFYETRDGHFFRSIDTLLKQPSVQIYYKTAVTKSSINVDNDFKISSFSVNKNQNLINAIAAGVYSSRRVLFNPNTFKLEETPFVLDEKTLSNSLGNKIIPTPENKDYARVFYDVKDVGTLSSQVAKGNAVSDPNEWQGVVQMRYNLLMSQVVTMQVPCNPKLKAGDVVECNIEKITLSNKNGQPFDPVESGRYLILDLCHHYDTERSFTSMTLVRDTYGLYKGN